MSGQEGCDNIHTIVPVTDPPSGTRGRIRHGPEIFPSSVHHILREVLGLGRLEVHLLAPYADADGDKARHAVRLKDVAGVLSRRAQCDEIERVGE